MKIIKKKNMKRKNITADAILITLCLILSTTIAIADPSVEKQSQQLSSTSIDNGSFDDPQRTDEIELHYYEGEYPDTYWGGYAPGVIWHAAIRFTPLELYEYSDWWLTSVRFFHGVGPFQPYEDHNVTVYVYDQGTIHEPGQILTSEYFVADTVGWITIPLSEPIHIDGTKDLWISFRTTQGEITYNYFGIGSIPGEDRKSMWINQYNEWMQLTDINPGWSFDWFIGAFIQEDTPETAELSLSNLKGGLKVHA